jgi:chorismate mutase
MDKDSEKKGRKGTGNPIGRPKKAKKNPIGRPKGEAAIMKEYRARMLNSPKSAKVLESIFNAALDDEHKNQAAAWKIVMDRMAPVSSFEKEAGSGQRQSIQVIVSDVESLNIGTTEEATPAPQDALDASFEVVDAKGPEE